MSNFKIYCGFIFSYSFQFNQFIFTVVLYAVFAAYFAGVMVRLMLTLTPVVCVLAGIAFSNTISKFVKVCESVCWIFSPFPALGIRFYQLRWASGWSVCVWSCKPELDVSRRVSVSTLNFSENGHVSIEFRSLIPNQQQ